jgi:hypothetical protein
MRLPAEAGAAPATVNGELLAARTPLGSQQSREGKAGSAEAVSQETCQALFVYSLAGVCQ